MIVEDFKYMIGFYPLVTGQITTPKTTPGFFVWYGTEVEFGKWTVVAAQNRQCRPTTNKIAFQSKADHGRMCYDLDVDPMTDIPP